MKISILTMFNGLSTTYSLVNVVADQIKMLLDNNYEVTLLVGEDLQDSEKYGIFLDERIKWIKIINNINGKRITWYDYSTGVGSIHNSFADEVNIIGNDLVGKLLDTDICIMHDILYQGWHLVHNCAIRLAQKRLPNLKFISFTHSLPVERPQKMDYPFSVRYTQMENTLYVYPTYSGINALANQYDAPIGNCRVVYNTIPILENLCPEVREINNYFDLLDTDILVVYPGRFTTGKKFEKVAALCGTINKTTNKTVKIIFCNFPSSDISVNKYKKMIINEGIKYGMKEENIFFTADIDKFKNGIPRKAVFDLFTLSNLFICPSFSESFGLTVLEAGSRGNYIVLNEAVPALEELGKALKCHMMRWDAKNFGFDTQENYHPSEEFYYIEHGNKIVEEMFKDKSIFAKSIIKKQYSSKWIFRNQLEPLLKKI